ncbi:hypothetical protein SAMN03080601_00744 [Alkalitalea saponilacus]|uniref:Uncharacterized protein n=1 Tax=Alkalitalea saponilacus TaxID=889453 RepID=A0A1T5CAZ7_9BACT|nr:hypothetical protein SAMN03080601_00744 [Alkalitalea saponilacus]
MEVNRENTVIIGNDLTHKPILKNRSIYVHSNIGIREVIRKVLSLCLTNRPAKSHGINTSLWFNILYWAMLLLKSIDVIFQSM